MFLSRPSRDDNPGFDQIFPVRTKVTEQMHGAMHGGVRKHNNQKQFQQSEVLKSTAVCVLGVGVGRF